jgi:hypothetical protein
LYLGTHPTEISNKTNKFGNNLGQMKENLNPEKRKQNSGIVTTRDSGPLQLLDVVEHPVPKQTADHTPSWIAIANDRYISTDTDRQVQMALDFKNSDNPNIDSSLTMDPPAEYNSPPAILPNLDATQAITESFEMLPEPADAPQEQPAPLIYTPAKLFQATGDVRNLARSASSPSGFTVHIYDRHTRTWVVDINFSDIAVRGQLYILWKTSWQEHLQPGTVDREMVIDAAAMTLHDIQKDNNKWERNYSAARRRDWHPNFTAFYDDIFKGVWAHRMWPGADALPEPPRFLAEMARKLTKSAGMGAGTSIHQPVQVVGQVDGELSMSPVALRTLKLRVIELEGMNQTLREELGLSLFVIS